MPDWTEDQPKVAGWYWVQDRRSIGGELDAPEIAWVFELNGEMRCSMGCGITEILKHLAGSFLWYGPLIPPGQPLRKAQ